MNQLCKVCGEPAAGYHFGAFTCEGCKSFFGRTYNNLSSIGECKNRNECVINKKNRTSCKSCRLKKCLFVGMSKTGSRYGRRSNWFKLHCLIDNQSNQTANNSNGSIQLNESFNENKDLVNQIKSEANNSRDVHHLKSPTTNGINNNNLNNNNHNKSNNSNNKSHIINSIKNSSTNNNNSNHNGNCNNNNNNINSNHTLHNITNHSNVVITSNGKQNHVSPGTHSSSNGPSPFTPSEDSTGRSNLSFLQVLGLSRFDPTNSFMIHPHSDSKTGLNLLNAAAAAAAAQHATSSSKTSSDHHPNLNVHPHHHPHHNNSNHPLRSLHSQFLHPSLKAVAPSSPQPSTGPQVNLVSNLTSSMSNSSSPSITSNARVTTPNDNHTFPFHSHHHGNHPPGSQTHSHGLPISPIAPMSPLDPSSRLFFQSAAAQLFGKGFNVLPKDINNYLLSSAYSNRFFPIETMNQVAKLTSSAMSLSPSPHHLLNLNGNPPSPSDIIYGSDQERPIDLSRKATTTTSSRKKASSNNHFSNKSKKQPRRRTTTTTANRGSEDEEEEEDEIADEVDEDEEEDVELCLNDDNNNPTGDEGSKSCMIGDHDSGFSPSSNEDNLVTTPLDLTAKKSPTPPPSAPPSMTLP